ncbi:MAG: helix-turn-helix domain-containing protein [Myxococcota bacterium]
MREANVEARRRRILDAARRLIERDGIESLSMRKLASEAAVSVTTLYNLFGARDDILVAMIADAVDGMIAVLDAESTLDDPIDRCFAVIEVSVREFGENERTHRPMMVAGFAAQALEADAERRIARRAIELQREGLEAAKARGLLRAEADPIRLGEQIYHGYELACAQWAWGRLDLDAFEARALYGLVLALQAVATEALRAELDVRRAVLERRLARVERTSTTGNAHPRAPKASVSEATASGTRARRRRS